MSGEAFVSHETWEHRLYEVGMSAYHIELIREWREHDPHIAAMVSLMCSTGNVVDALGAGLMAMVGANREMLKQNIELAERSVMAIQVSE